MTVTVWARTTIRFRPAQLARLLCRYCPQNHNPREQSNHWAKTSSVAVLLWGWPTCRQMTASRSHLDRSWRSRPEWSRQSCFADQSRRHDRFPKGDRMRRFRRCRMSLLVDQCWMQSPRGSSNRPDQFRSNRMATMFRRVGCGRRRVSRTELDRHRRQMTAIGVRQQMSGHQEMAGYRWEADRSSLRSCHEWGPGRSRGQRLRPPVHSVAQRGCFPRSHAWFRCALWMLHPLQTGLVGSRTRLM